MKRQASSRGRRGASLYVAVMGVGMIVGVIALTTSVTGRVQLRMNEAHRNSLVAEAEAHNGIEYALNWMNLNADWRTRLTSGVDTDSFQSQSGGFRIRVTDVDGDLADDPRDHAVLRSVGIANGSSYALEVDIEPAGRALTCLEAATHSATSTTVGDASTLTGAGIASAGSDFVANSSTIELDVEAGLLASGSSYSASTTEGVTAREMPGEHAFDWYVEHGTEIALADLTPIFGSSYLTSSVLSRNFNGYSDTNPHGIYWIDCAGESPRISWFRSNGTLVLLNAGADTRVEDVSLLQAEAMNYPAIMVQGDLSLDLNSSSIGQELRESLWVFFLQLGANYNPTGAAYEGVEDDDRDDTYPARIDGIVYATGRITITDETDIQGNLIANEIVVNDGKKLAADYKPYAYNYPPPGFSAGQGARVLPGSYRRVSLDTE